MTVRSADTPGLALLGAAARTPLGTLAETIAALPTRYADQVTALTAGEGVRHLHMGRSPGGGRTGRLLGPLPALAVEVAREAATGLPAGDRTGVFLATGGLRAHWDELAPAMAEQRADAAGAWARGLKRLHPLWMLRYLSNGAQAAIAYELGFIGDGATFAGPAAAASAIVAAGAAIDARVISHALVVALDDQTADEVAVELAARHPALVPGVGVAAIALTAAGTGLTVAAVDGVDPDHAEPGAAAIAAVRARLPAADHDLCFAAQLGYLGAAGPLVDLAIAAHFLTSGWPAGLGGATGPRSITCTAAASPGQIGVLRLATRGAPA